ncbi:MAG: TetR/AcrR family transcriptional regulator [Bacteroidia bacterium]
MFKTLGVKSVSMDDIAKELSISKKTIYQHYKDKKELVNEAFGHDLELDKRACMETCEQTENAIQQFLNISSFISNNLKDMNPAVLYDLRKYYPECSNRFDNFTKEVVYEFMLNNIVIGIEQGLYRKDLHPEFASTIYISLVREFTTMGLNQLGLKLQNLHKEMITYHLYAICTTKGINYFKKHL